MDIQSTHGGEPGHMKGMREVTASLHDIGRNDILSGQWFTKLLFSRLRAFEVERARHAAEATPSAHARARAETLVRRVSLEAALIGAGAASLATGASWITAETGGLAGLFAIPLAALGIGGEMLYRAHLHVRMACEVGAELGVGFTAADAKELMRLFALAFGVERHEDESDPGRHLVERLVHLNEYEGGQVIGSRLTSESLLRDILPFVGVPASSVVSYRLTRRLGDIVRRYAHARRAIEGALRDAQRYVPGRYELLVEGLWFVFIADDRLNEVEAALLAHLIESRPPDGPQQITMRFLSDEQAWLERLRGIRESAAQSALLRAFELAVATGERLQPQERAMLQKAAEALGQPFDAATVETMARESWTAPAPPMAS